MPRRKKHFNDCEHVGFGTFCHRCNPWKPMASRTSAEIQNKCGIKVTKKEERK
ncbi:hypothetical protein LCGC14_1196630 [marine sediment metagenome]|uniref:Uncharacterized protein n=1 Tax=marine sediment metagenome TaxID=412755 RepID=A0A0F9P0K0_9ZZZZ